MAVRRGGRATHRLVQFRSTVAGGDADAHFAQVVLPAIRFPRLTQRVYQGLYTLHDVRFVYGTGRVVDAPCLCRIGVDTFL